MVQTVARVTEKGLVEEGRKEKREEEISHFKKVITSEPGFQG